MFFVLNPYRVSELPFPSFPEMFFRIRVGDPSNTVEQNNQTFAPSDVDVSNDKIAIANIVYSRASSTAASMNGTVGYFSNQGGALPGGIVAGKAYFLSPVSGGYELYAETEAGDWVNTPNALPDEKIMPAQNFFQRVNKVNITSQGTGTHTFYTNKLSKSLNDIAGVLATAHSVGTTSTNQHERWEILKDVNGIEYINSRILARDPTANGTYNLYGYKQEHVGDRTEFQTPMRNKRAVILTAVLNWGETDTYGLTKAPFAPANVNTTTGVLTYTAHGFATGNKSRVLVYPTGTLPTGYTAATDYWVRAASANTITLHPTLADASANTNIIIPTTQGAVGFIVYATQRGGDGERMRFVAEIREPSTGANTITVRTNGGGLGDGNFVGSTDFVATGSNNGDVGAVGRTLVGMVPTAFDVFKVRVRTHAGSVAPTRQDTGLPLTDGFYWINRKQTSGAYVRLYDSEATALANVNATTALSNCIKFSAVGDGFTRIEAETTRGFAASGERGVSEGLTPNMWSPYNRGKGVLTVVIDYNDPTATNVRNKIYWNGIKVADFETATSKGNTSSGISLSDTGMSLLNSAASHVTFEGGFYELILGASDSEITDASIMQRDPWLMAHYAI